jgi:hypothetical protein
MDPCKSQARLQNVQPVRVGPLDFGKPAICLKGKVSVESKRMRELTVEPLIGIAI